MNNEAIILQALEDMLKSPGQKVSLDYLLMRLPRETGMPPGQIKEMIAALETQGRIRTEQVGRRTRLVSLPAGGEAPRKDSQETNRNSPRGKRKGLKLQGRDYGMILGIVASIVTIITCLPTMLSFAEDIQQKTRPVEDYLIIQSSELQPENNIVRQDVDLSSFDPQNQTLDEIRLRCMNQSEDCRSLMMPSSTGAVPQLKIQVTSKQEGHPLSITGIQVTLKEFRDLPQAPFNSYFYSGGCGGGGGYISYILFDLESPEAPDDSLPFTLGAYPAGNTAPQSLVGKTFKAGMACADDSCETFQYVTSDQVEGLELQMPFLESLPPGWYEFEARPAYSYAGEEYASSEAIVFDVLKPEIVRYWWSPCGIKPFSSFLNVDLVTGSMAPNIELEPMQNPAATLVFNSVAAMDNGYYSLDLQSGAFRRLNERAFAPYKTEAHLPSAISADGLTWAHEVKGDEWFRSPDIGVFDLRQERFFTVTGSDQNNHIHPAVSPSGKQVAYVKYVDEADTEELKMGEADLYLYDLDTQTTQRITFTPGVIELQPAWVTDRLIAFLVPELQMPYESIPVEQSSVGLILHDLGTGEEQTINLFADENTSVTYLPAKGALFVEGSNGMILQQERPVSYLIDIASRSIRTVELPPVYFTVGASCSLLDTGEDIFLCQDLANSTIQLFRKTGTGFLKYYEQVNPDSNSMVMGSVAPGHLAVANLARAVIYEFDQEGNVAREWSLPQADQLLHFYSGGSHTTEFVILPKEETSAAPTSVPTAIPAQPFQVEERFIDASRPELNVGISFSVPWITGSAQADRFNGFVQQYVDEDLAGTLSFLSEPIPDPGGGMSVHYAVTSSDQWVAGDTPFMIPQSSPLLAYDDAIINAGQDVISILFENNGYFGGAHPGTSHATINFDLSTGTKLELQNLFLPGSDYLTYLSSYSIVDLPKREQYLFDDFRENAGPDEKNFSVWAITHQGLLIIFEEYQVAPYASGPQYVLIPFDYLNPIIDPNGPLGLYGN